MAKNRTWRYLDNCPTDGIMNMSIDEAILLSYNDTQVSPVLRLYQWERPTISIGRFQNPFLTLNIDACKADGINIVRRITGGSSIFHTPEEITYSVVCHDYDIGEGMTVKETYKVLCQFLIRFYGELGLNADFAVDLITNEILGLKSALCFAAKEEYDIIVNGKKIGGNAQKRLKHIIFQHGSIPLEFNADIINKYIKDIPADIYDRTTSLRDLHINNDVDSMKKIIFDSFTKSIGNNYDATSLSNKEENLAGFLFTNKYNNDLWNIECNNVEVTKKVNDYIASQNV